MLVDAPDTRYQYRRRRPLVGSHDIDDDQVIAAAGAAQADLIISGDRKHLLPLGSYAGISIVTPAETLRRIDNK